ncbi:class I adenylate-forming enzyme family protein [Couchioplanes azureus]|uniref:class I adenylate-forming enzyme family protein n=1 Tax=Couchioplanes caeruleus TaxID=56438 RepID=UPI0016715C87|nr:class I adenylate-forming enzyme family protein [Couchioplanes caeruleus]GGQ65132.1 coronafacic acid synthetase [Couchioplanes caeruleus subsp. azureus]
MSASVTYAAAARFLSAVHDLGDPSGAAVTGLDDVTRGLHAAGIAPGEPVLIVAPNGAGLLHLFLGTLLAGAVPVLMSPAITSERLRSNAEALGARAVVVPAPAPLLPEAVARHRWGGVELRLLGATATTYAPDHVIILTSGTSGILSGCLHETRSLVRNASRHAAAVGLREGDTVLANLPLHFSYALVAQALAALVTGARLAVTGPPFTPTGFTAAIEASEASSASLTPYMVRTLLAAEWKPPAPLRMLTVGGDALAAADVARLLDHCPGVEVYLTYGLTEAGPRVSTLAAHREPPHRWSSVGLPLDGVGVALGDGADGAGELLVSTDTRMVRKVGRTDAVAGSRILPDGRIATGDIFRIDPDGYLHFQARRSDSVVVHGSKVSLRSVRRVAEALPGVASAEVTCAPDEHGEPQIRVRLFTDRTDTGAALRRDLLRQLLPAERPKRCEVLPLTAKGHK